MHPLKIFDRLPTHPARLLCIQFNYAINGSLGIFILRILHSSVLLLSSSSSSASRNFWPNSPNSFVPIQSRRSVLLVWFPYLRIKYSSITEKTLNNWRSHREDSTCLAKLQTFKKTLPDPCFSFSSCSSFRLCFYCFCEWWFI